MLHEKGGFKGRGNLRLFYQCWLPSGNIAAVLLLVHGLADHSGRYTNLVNYFAPRGYAVYSYDHRGHGKSDGPRCYVARFSDYVDDLDVLVIKAREEHPETPIFLFGHSMGGTIATAYAIRYQSKLAGLLLSGAVLKLGSSVSPVLIAVSGILSSLLPKMGVSSLETSALSQDSAVVDAYVKDPLVYQGKVRARVGGELIKTIQSLPSQMSRITIPVLIMHGTADRLSDPQGSQMLHQRVGSHDKTLKLYEGFYHEIFNEPKREQVFRDMESWLTAHK